MKLSDTALNAALEVPDLHNKTIRVNKFLSKQSQVPFFKFVLDVYQNGINRSTYRKRIDILKMHCQLQEESSAIKLFTLDTAVVVGWLVGSLLQNAPSLTEEAQCSQGCMPYLNVLTTKNMDISIILGKNSAEEMAKECIVTQKVRCRTKGCTGTANIILKSIGPLFVIDMSNSLDDNKQIPIKKLPSTMNNPMDKSKHLQLVGIIAYRGSSRNSFPEITLAANDDDATMLRRTAALMSHYVAAVKRGNTWHEFDDIKCTRKTLKENTKLVPHLLFFK
ncbi:uncharacterized protein [Eurosta solidaginis]|uniref:uncharacterized protein isoform X2 n=1 Tax=Eurosta solidaginis TaxID=178769 RepID=UPI0035313EDF